MYTKKKHQGASFFMVKGVVMLAVSKVAWWCYWGFLQSISTLFPSASVVANM